MEFAYKILSSFWAELAEMSPYLLFGFFVAGMLSVFLSPKLIENHLGGRGIWPAIKAAAFGVPLPLCSCGVIPVAMSLRKNNASKAATISFLLSTPQTGVDSILVTYSMLGPVFAIFRPIVALITGVVGGIATELSCSENNKQQTKSATCGQDDSTEKKSSWIRQIFKFGFITMPRSIARPMLAGLVIAAILSAVVPDDFFAEKLGTGITAMILMLFLGIPVYVCATASVPIAAVMMAKGLSAGAVIVFLMTGPATNTISFITIYKTLGLRVAVVYIITVVVCALGSGIFMDYIIVPGFTETAAGMSMQMLPETVKNISAVLILAVLGAAVIHRKILLKPEGSKQNGNRQS